MDWWKDWDEKREGGGNLQSWNVVGLMVHFLEKEFQGEEEDQGMR